MEEKEIKELKTEELLYDSMMEISNLLKRLSKVKFRNRGYFYEDDDGELKFYLGDKDHYILKGYFKKDEESKRPVFTLMNEVKYWDFWFLKSQIKDRITREIMTMTMVEKFYESDLKDFDFEEYFSDKLGFSLPFSKCFSVVTTHGKPYTGARDEKPWVIYHRKYMNQMSGECCGKQVENMLKVVGKKFDELGIVDVKDVIPNPYLTAGGMNLT